MSWPVHFHTDVFDVVFSIIEVHQRYKLRHCPIKAGCKEKILWAAKVKRIKRERMKMIKLEKESKESKQEAEDEGIR
jgi:hypothetical protein